MAERGNGPDDGTRRSLRGHCVRNQHATPLSGCSRGPVSCFTGDGSGAYPVNNRACPGRRSGAQADGGSLQPSLPRRVAYELLAQLAFPRLDVIILRAVACSPTLPLRITMFVVRFGDAPAPNPFSTLLGGRAESSFEKDTPAGVGEAPRIQVRRAHLFSFPAE